MTTTDVATQQHSTILAISSGQSWFTDRQLAALHHMGVAQDVPKGDLAIFLNQCQRTGLDPFAKQIYMLGRNVRENDRWVTKYTIQTGIDGYRVIGDRVAEQRGDDIEHADPLWADKNGVWTDVWLSEEPPVAAKYTIIKNGKRNVATVMYREFVQTKKDGTPNSMWARMPCNQLLKCAESNAWKKLYPNDFAGLLLEGAAHPTDDMSAPAPAAVQAAPLRVTADEIMAVADPELEAREDEVRRRSDAARRKSLNRMFAMFKKADLDGDENRADRLTVTSKLVERPVESSDDLSDIELQTLNSELTALDKGGRLDDTVREILNRAALAAENQQTGDPDEQQSLL